MTNQIQYNKVVVSPTLHFQNKSDLAWATNTLLPDESVRKTHLFQLIRRYGHKAIANSIEIYTRSMLAHCAVTVQIPYPKNTSFPSIRSLKQNMSPSIRNRVAFLDYRHTLWSSIQKYLEPVLDFKEAGYFDEHRFAWNLYLLALGERTRSDVIVSPKEQLQIIKSIKNNNKKLNDEAKARLGIIEGIYRTYSQPEEVPGFKFISQSANISERLEEIIEDAYMLEASHLRRLLGLRSNLMTLKRDLRRLTKFIVSNRKWAKGVVDVADLVGYVPSGKSIGEFLELVTTNSANINSPVCIDPESHKKNLSITSGTVIEVQLYRELFFLSPWPMAN